MVWAWIFYYYYYYYLQPPTFHTTSYSQIVSGLSWVNVGTRARALVGESSFGGDGNVATRSAILTGLGIDL